MRFEVKIESDGVALAGRGGYEVVDILRNLADVIEETDLEEGALRDHNGNTVGRWELRT